MSQSNHTDERVNPFESPLSTEPSLPPAATGDWEYQRGRGPVAMFFIGALTGGIVAAFAGAGGAAMLGILVGLSGISHGDGVDLAFFGAILGAGCGVSAGLPWGAILGVVFGLNRPRSRGWLRFLAISVSALIGIGVGWMGGAILSDFPGKSPVLTLTVGTGIMCGGGAGALGGWLLAGMLSSLCWDRPPVRTTVG